MATADGDDSLERLDLPGHFWRPEDEAEDDHEENRERWAGRLVEDPVRGIAVTASAPDRHDLLMETFAPIVWGRTVDKLVTMTDVELNVAGKMPGGTEVTLRPWRTFVGRRAFESEDDIAFKRVVLRVEGLDEWAATSGFSRSRPASPERYAIEYERPAPIPLGTVDGIEIDVNFWSSTSPKGDPTVRWRLAQEAVIRFQSPEPVAYGTLEPLAQHVRNFVMFAGREALDVVFTRGYIDPLDDLTYPDGYLDDVAIWSRYFPRRDAAASPPTRREAFLFTARDSDTSTPTRLERWLSLTAEDDLGPVLDLYLSTLYQPRAFVEFRVLALAQAAESLHSRRFDAQLLPKAAHKANVAAVLKAVSSDELREWAKVRLEGANRKTYYDALVELVNALPAGVRALLPEPESFVAKVKTTRHYLTHWNPDLRAEAATTLGELDGLARALRCVLEALLLLELGFTPEEADVRLEKNLNYRRELSRGLEAAGLS